MGKAGFSTNTPKTSRALRAGGVLIRLGRGSRTPRACATACRPARQVDLLGTSTNHFGGGSPSHLGLLENTVDGQSPAGSWLFPGFIGFHPFELVRPQQMA